MPLVDQFYIKKPHRFCFLKLFARSCGQQGGVRYVDANVEVDEALIGVVSCGDKDRVRVGDVGRHCSDAGAGIYLICSPPKIKIYR